RRGSAFGRNPSARGVRNPFLASLGVAPASWTPRKEVLELLLTAHPGRLPTERDLLGHLAGGLVDHLGAEHHGAAKLDVGGLPVRLEQSLGLVELLLRRREDLVQHVDLPGVQRPLAVVAQLSGAYRHLPKS